MTYAGYVHFNPSVLSALQLRKLDMDNNLYFTRPLNGFRVNKQRDYKINQWQKEFNIEQNSQLSQLKDFEIEPILKVQQLKTNSNHFNIALLSKSGSDVTIDFGNYNIEEGMTYNIYDAENRSMVIKFGKVSRDLKIEFPMGLKQIEMPLHNTVAIKSADNFGVYRIEFTKKAKRKTFFGRLFGWLF